MKINFFSFCLEINITEVTFIKKFSGQDIKIGKYLGNLPGLSEIAYEGQGQELLYFFEKIKRSHMSVKKPLKICFSQFQAFLAIPRGGR